jgi:hypothetical protein
LVDEGTPLLRAYIDRSLAGVTGDLIARYEVCEPLKVFLIAVRARNGQPNEIKGAGHNGPPVKGGICADARPKDNFRRSLPCAGHDLAPAPYPGLLIAVSMEPATILKTTYAAVICCAAIHDAASKIVAAITTAPKINTAIIWDIVYAPGILTFVSFLSSSIDAHKPPILRAAASP